jgi:hypothetical protein
VTYVNLASFKRCCINWSHQWISVERWCEEDAAFDAVLGDDPDAADASRAAVVEHRVKNCFFDKLDAGFLFHVFLEVLANESVDEGTSRTADSAALTDDHSTWSQFNIKMRSTRKSTEITQWNRIHLSTINVIVSSDDDSSHDRITVAVTKAAEFSGNI